MRKGLFAAVIGAAVIAGAAAAWWMNADQKIELAAGTALTPRRAIADFSLTDHRGDAFTQASLRGRWSLLFTGFTHCPDLCPATLTLLAELDRRLPAGSVQLLFLSVDPERDTPELIAAYVAHFGPRLIGVTGARAEIDGLTAALGLAQVRNPGVGGDYTVDHSTALVLIDPRARIAGYFTPPHDIGALAADLASIHRRSP
ncbi:MAG: SCO family protein [Steroidobacteraceae bacterium]